MKIKNRKKVIVLCAAFVAAGVGMNVQNAIAGYGMNQDVVSLVASGSSNSNSNGSNYLESNASALSSSSNGGRGVYTKSQGPCPTPCSWKKWVSCKVGGTEECFSSDCC